MVDPIKPDQRSVGPGEGPRAAAAANGEPDVAFRALLERLKAGAERVAQSSESASDPRSLSTAVGEARASLDAMLSISERLLEACRADQCRADAPDSAGRKRSA
ncbi:MAG: hypothetical protein ACK57N_05245 [Planctomycetia bacterium]